jgi:hypothetical protein
MKTIFLLIESFGPITVMVLAILYMVRRKPGKIVRFEDYEFNNKEKAKPTHNETRNQNSLNNNLFTHPRRMVYHFGGENKK